MDSTEGLEYAQRLERLSGAGWKQLLDVQRPYRWNLERLQLGSTLDVGCGIGRNLQGLQNSVGVDHNQTSVDIARSRGFRAWSTAEWETSEDFSKTYDSLLFAHVLEHMQFNEAVDLVRHYTPHLKSGGRVVVICPQEAGFRSDPTHVEFFVPGKIAQVFTANNIVPDRHYSFPFPRPAGRVFRHNEFVVVGHKN